ncbi:MAG: hypothetical protein ACRBBW_08100 [Cellvibrionaceae bacterium]
MGIFSRQSDDDNTDDDFSQVELPSKKDLNTSFLDDANFDSPPVPRAAPRKPNYDIEKAIQLMNSLPPGEAQLIVTVVQQTLESTGVDVSEIIRDADKKEKQLNQQHKELREDIRQLEAQIADKNQKIKSLLEDLKVTSHVKQQLLLTQPTKEAKTDTQATEPTPTAKAESIDPADNPGATLKTSRQNPPPKPMH